MQGYTRGDIFPIQMKINCSQCVSTQKRSVTTCHQQEIIQLHQLDFHQDASQHFYQQKDSRLCPKTSILSVIKVCCKGADKQRKDTPGVSQTPTEEANRRWSTTLSPVPSNYAKIYLVVVSWFFYKLGHCRQLNWTSVTWYKLGKRLLHTCPSTDFWC